MTTQPIDEPIENQGRDDNPGHYIAAFFPVIKSNDPNVVHRDDKYLREGRNVSERDTLGFINLQMHNQDNPVFMMALYQSPGSSDFTIRLMASDGRNRGTRALTFRDFQERDRFDYRKNYNRRVWMGRYYDDYFPGDRYIVNMDGNKLQIFFRDGNSLNAAATFTSTEYQENGAAAWKISDSDRTIDNLSITYMEPFEVKRMFIPTKEQMLSGTEHADINFLSIELNSMNLKGINLLRGNLSRVRMFNTKFDLSRLESCIFGNPDQDRYREPRFTNNSFVGVNLSRSKFEQIQIGNCNFNQSNLTETSFKDTSFENTSFQGANLSKTDFSGVDFTVFTFDGTLKRESGQGTLLRNAKVPYTLIRNDWQNLNLSEATFHGTFPTGSIDGRGVWLVKSQLADFNFSKANFTNANLSGANLRGSNLSEANLTGADLTGADLTGANLTRANLSGTKLPSTILDRADLTGVVFTTPPVFGRAVDARTRCRETVVHASFFGNNWSFLDLKDVKFTSSVADIPRPLTAKYVILDNLTFNGGNFENANFEFAQFKDAHLPNCILKNAKLQSSVLIGAIFTNANMWGAVLENADITNASFEGAELYGNNGSLKGATAINVSFNDAYLANLDFSDIKGKSLQGCNFSGSCLVNAKFNNTRLGTLGGSSGGKVTSFANASLQGTTFENSDLSEVNLTNAAIATESGDFTVAIRSSSVPKIKFNRTMLDPKITARKTICPSGDSGPCTVETMRTKNPFTNNWAHKQLRKDTEEK